MVTGHNTRMAVLFTQARALRHEETLPYGRIAVGVARKVCSAEVLYNSESAAP